MSAAATRTKGAAGSGTYHANGASSAAAGSVTSVLQSTRSLALIATADQDESDVLSCAANWLHFFRCSVLVPLQSAASSSGLSLAQLQKAWDERVEPKLLAILGPLACADSSSAKKGECGPLVTAVFATLKSKGCSSVRLPRDLLEALASASLETWLERYAVASPPPGTAVPTSGSKFCRQSELIAAVVQRTLQEWLAALTTAQSRSASASGAGTAALVVSSSPSLEATLADFRPLIASSSSRLYATVFELLRPSVKLTGSAGSGAVGRVQRELEQATRHKTVLARFDATWAAAALASGGKSKHKGAASAAAASDSSSSGDGTATRTCKLFGASNCLEHDRAIAPSSKFVFVRCSAGHASSFHQNCWAEAEALAEVDAEAEDGGDEHKRCVHASTNKCKERIVTADLKQQGKLLARLFGDAEANGHSSTGPDEDTVQLPASADVAASLLGGEASGDLLAARRHRGQRTASSMVSIKSSKLQRVRTLDDGTVVFQDQLDKMERAALKAEKQRQAEAKRQAEAEAAAAAAKLQAAADEESNGKPAAAAKTKAVADYSASAAASSSIAAPARPFTFEVVVKAPPRPVAVVAPVPPAEPVAAASSSVTPAASPAAAVQPSPAVSTSASASATSVPPAAAPQAPTPSAAFSRIRLKQQPPPSASPDAAAHSSATIPTSTQAAVQEAQRREAPATPAPAVSASPCVMVFSAAAPAESASAAAQTVDSPSAMPPPAPLASSASTSSSSAASTKKTPLMSRRVARAKADALAQQQERELQRKIDEATANAANASEAALQAALTNAAKPKVKRKQQPAAEASAAAASSADNAFTAATNSAASAAADESDEEGRLSEIASAAAFELDSKLDFDFDDDEDDELDEKSACEPLENGAAAHQSGERHSDEGAANGGTNGAAAASADALADHIASFTSLFSLASSSSRAASQSGTNLSSVADEDEVIQPGSNRGSPSRCGSAMLASLRNGDDELAAPKDLASIFASSTPLSRSGSSSPAKNFSRAIQPPLPSAVGAASALPLWQPIATQGNQTTALSSATNTSSNGVAATQPSASPAAQPPAAVAPSPSPSPAAAAWAPPRLVVLDDILASAAPTAALLLRQLPPSLGATELSQLFGPFGRLTSIKVVVTNTHGVVAAVQFEQTNSAVAAQRALRGQAFEIVSTPTVLPSALAGSRFTPPAAPKVQRWHVPELLFAVVPLVELRTPAVTLRLARPSPQPTLVHQSSPGQLPFLPQVPPQQPQQQPQQQTLQHQPRAQLHQPQRPLPVPFGMQPLFLPHQLPQQPQLQMQRGFAYTQPGPYSGFGRR